MVDLLIYLAAWFAPILAIVAWQYLRAHREVLEERAEEERQRGASSPSGTM